MAPSGSRVVLDVVRPLWGRAQAAVVAVCLTGLLGFIVVTTARGSATSWWGRALTAGLVLLAVPLLRLLVLLALWRPRVELDANVLVLTDRLLLRRPWRIDRSEVAVVEPLQREHPWTGLSSSGRPRTDECGLAPLPDRLNVRIRFVEPIRPSGVRTWIFGNGLVDWIWRVPYHLRVPVVGRSYAGVLLHLRDPERLVTWWLEAPRTRDAPTVDDVLADRG